MYDPGDPTPDPSFYEPSDADEAAKRRPEDLLKDAEARRGKVTGSRQDILVYTTEPFTSPYTMVGPVSAVIYASSSARDTDWFVHLVEVDENGAFLPLIGVDCGKVRARYRISLNKTRFLKPGEIYKYSIDLWQTGITIRPGHRLRIELASADFPSYSRNLNTGGNNETGTKFVSANQAIYHDPKHPVLPSAAENPRESVGFGPRPAVPILRALCSTPSFSGFVFGFLRVFLRVLRGSASSATPLTPGMIGSDFAESL